MMNSFISNCAHCGLETEIARFSEGSFLCEECSKLDVNKNKTKSKDAKPNKLKSKKNITRKSLRFLGKPRVVYSKSNPDNEESKKESRIRRQEKQLEPPYSCSISLTTDMVYFSGMRWKIGDIVGLRDKKDQRTYYAQIRGFLQDQYCEKSACLTWLLPTADAPEDEFDPDHYYLGPEEEVPRKLEYMEFICHTPSSYYKKPANMPGSIKPINPESGFIWTKEDSGVCYKIDECKKICDKPRFVAPHSSNDNDEIDDEFYEPKRQRSLRDDDDNIRIGEDYRNPNFEGSSRYPSRYFKFVKKRIKKEINSTIMMIMCSRIDRINKLKNV